MDQQEPNERPVRVRFPVDVGFCGAQFQLREFTANLSVGGAFLPTDWEIPVGSVGKLTFRISQWEAPFTVEAQVVRCFRKDEEAHGYPSGVGIQFVDLDHAAGADTQITMDAGIQINRHRRMAWIGRRGLAAFARRQAARDDAGTVRPLPKFRLRIGGRFARRLIGHQ